MSGGIPKSVFRNGLRSLGSLFIFLTLMSLMACFLAIPAIVYYATPEGYLATAELRVNADKVYQEALRTAEEKAEGGSVEILEKDDSKLRLELTDGVQKAIIKVTSISKSKSQLTVRADVPDMKEEKEETKKEEELALRIVKTICDNLGVKYELVKD